jgi:hypothetical protein
MVPTAHAPGRSGKGSGGPYLTCSARSVLSGWQKVKGGPGVQNGAPGYPPNLARTSYVETRGTFGSIGESV